MFNLSPSPRFKIYGSASTYMSVFKDVLFQKVHAGDDCQVLEEKAKQFFKADMCLAMPQARVGIYHAIKAVIKPGQKVILSPYTIADVINMVICAGGIPVFADLEDNTCNIDPAQIETLIDDNTGAVMVTHLHGLMCDMPRIVKICKACNIPLLEDASQAFGAVQDGKKAGTFGEIGIFSMGRYKNINSFYGGLLLTSNKGVYQTVREMMSKYPVMEVTPLVKRVIVASLKDLATLNPLFQSLVYPIFRFGHLKQIRTINKFVETELDLSLKHEIPETYLRQLSPLQARLATAQIDTIDSNYEIRLGYAKIYHEGLSDLLDITIPPRSLDGSHVYTCFPIRYKDRAKLVRFMMESKRDITVQHLKNCADLDSFAQFHVDLPIARETANEVVILPTYPSYGEQEVEKNVRCIRNFFNRGRYDQ